MPVFWAGPGRHFVSYSLRGGDMSILFAGGRNAAIGSRVLAWRRWCRRVEAGLCGLAPSEVSDLLRQRTVLFVGHNGRRGIVDLAWRPCRSVGRCFVNPMFARLIGRKERGKWQNRRCVCLGSVLSRYSIGDALIKYEPGSKKPNVNRRKSSKCLKAKMPGGCNHMHGGAFAKNDIERQLQDGVPFCKPRVTQS